MEIIKVILTALLSVASLFIITKIMGHKQVAQLDLFRLCQRHYYRLDRCGACH